MHNKLANDHLPGKSSVARQAIPVRELHVGHKDVILSHLLQLNDEDRCLRLRDKHVLQSSAFLYCQKGALRALALRS